MEEYQKTTLNNLSVDNWKCLLESEESDFAAILILYSISKKDAILLQRITKTEWAKFYKEKDIEYFMDILQTDVTHEQSNISIAVVL
ncbi:MAG: hypothetical protein R3B47_12035 [Bacteroidia bacterium]